MKKLSWQLEDWLSRRNDRLAHKAICRANHQRHKKKPLRPGRKTATFTVPRLLVAEKIEQRQAILDVVVRMRTALKSKGTRVKLDFSRVHKLFPGGTLILLAALEQLTTKYPGRIFARCPPQSMSAQLLRHFELADKLGISPRYSRPESRSVLDWRYLTGTQADGEKVKALLDDYRQTVQAEIPDDLFTVLTEGLTNVRHHAYPDDSLVPVPDRRWWIFSRYVAPIENHPGSLYIAIYDLGVGIPSTMRNKLNKKEVVIDFIDKTAEAFALSNGLLDKQLLQAAIEHKRSQTGQPNRGKGLPDMREFVRSTANGRLYIISGKAQYSCLADADHGLTNGFSGHFPGTLLLWSLPLKAKELIQ